MHSEREHACPPPSRPLNHRSTGALCPLPLCCCSGEETEGRREEREEEEETYDSGPRCTTVQQVLSASKELTWTQMATLKPQEILRGNVLTRRSEGSEILRQRQVYLG
ncbi:Os11g0147150 [Oryza sativa Japonica Group]|uniref:Os11g0147150 protein n=1 Tax=Oryza sativa subsp. japonica TaxID=39947 RepID=A0A0N7KSF5_ORYSJ|nr:hypothetical protein EE612_053470 [Oryza sativa]BAT12674.1 Os11g0147150 [Oryza sativa Japonica Group]